jgi:hypothetical protein
MEYLEALLTILIFHLNYNRFHQGKAKGEQSYCKWKRC